MGLSNYRIRSRLRATYPYLLCLKRFRADEAVGAVSAGSIVVHFDVLEYRFPHGLPGGEYFAVYGLHLE
jgi:hypothetical protein